MANKKRNELTAGVFVIVCGLLTVGIVIWLSGVEIGGRYVYLSLPLTAGNTGVTVGGEAYLGSVLIGKVSAVTPSDDWHTFVVRIRLSQPVDIRSDALVESNTPALGGTATLTFLSRGSPAAAPADEAHPIAVRIGPNQLVRDMQQQLGYGEVERTELQTAMRSVTAIAGNLQTVSNTLSSRSPRPRSPPGRRRPCWPALWPCWRTCARRRRRSARAQEAQKQFDPANAAGLLGKLHLAMDNVDRVSGRAWELTDKVSPDVEKAVSSAARAAERIDQYTEKDMADLLASLRTSGDELLGVMRDMREVSGTAKQIVRLNRDNVGEILRNLTQVSVNLKVTAQDVRRSPWKLLGKPAVQEHPHRERPGDRPGLLRRGHRAGRRHQPAEGPGRAGQRTHPGRRPAAHPGPPEDQGRLRQLQPGRTGPVEGDGPVVVLAPFPCCV